MTHRPSASRRTLGVALAGTALLASLTACGGTERGQFVTGTAAYPVSCLQHQKQAPDAAYTDETRADTAQILTMLKYYTANRTVQKYCDGKVATALDKRWAQAYVNLGAEPQNVAHILNG
jgi:uncharacterized lipoprotein YmbA